MWYYLLYIVSLGSYVLWLINLGEIHSSVLCYINRKLLNDKIEHIILFAILLTTLVLFFACITGKGDVEETDTDTETATITETEETETEAGIPTKPDIPELDSYQGMPPDVPYTPEFKSNGDGT